MSTQTNNSSTKKNWIYGIIALLASLLGFWFFQQNTDETAIAIGDPEIAVTEAAPSEATSAEVSQSAEPEPVVVEEVPETPPQPVDQPAKPKKKTKKENVALKQPEPMKYNPSDFRPNDFFENMPASKSALSPAFLRSPTDNALILPDPQGDYRFQLAVECSAEKDDRIAVFPNNKAAYDNEKPLWRMVFPDTHSGMWKQYIKLDGKPGLYYVVLNSGGNARVLGKFILN